MEESDYSVDSQMEGSNESNNEEEESTFRDKRR